MIPRKPILVVGSINMDLVARATHIPVAGETVAGTSFVTYPGGKGANQAVAVAKLGHRVQLIGRLGSDSFGEELLHGLQAAGVDTREVKQVSGSSGVAVIIVSDQGENCIVVTPGANALLTPDDLEEHVDQIREAGAVLTQLETPIETVERLAAICSKYGVPLILDPAPAQHLSAELIQKVSWFTPNETEAKFFVDDLLADKDLSNDPAQVAQHLRELGASNIVLKRGGLGFYIAERTGLKETHSAYAVQAVDSTAAGDAFNGAFAVALVTGRSPVQSACFAAAAAAISVTRHGAQASMPTLAEVEEVLSSGPQA